MRDGKINKSEPSVYVVFGGADSGIGKAITERLESLGHGVVATGRSVDVRDAGMVNGVVREVGIHNGEAVAGFVYCPGVNELSWLGQMDLPTLRRASNILAVNSLGFLILVDAITREFGCDPDSGGSRVASGDMSILAVSSDAGERPLRTSSAYCASKAALNMLVRCAARELGPRGWRVNAVAPGMVSGTGMTEQMDDDIPKLRGWTEEEALKYEQSQEVVKGRVTPEEVAEVAVSTLTGPRHLNGAIIPVNGGR